MLSAMGGQHASGGSRRRRRPSPTAERAAHRGPGPRRARCPGARAGGHRSRAGRAPRRPRRSPRPSSRPSSCRARWSTRRRPAARSRRGRTAARRSTSCCPTGYADHPEQRYPVLWLLHGANGGTDTWIPGITELLAGLAGDHRHARRRARSGCTPTGGTAARAATRPGRPTTSRCCGRRSRSATGSVPGRRWHAIGGISMGGQGALRYAAMLPGYFGSVAGFSAALPDMQSVEAQGGVDPAWRWPPAASEATHHDDLRPRRPAPTPRGTARRRSRANSATPACS